jgi:stress response protein YsnF
MLMKKRDVTTPDDHTIPGDQSVPLVEEELTVRTRQVAKGTVRLEVGTETLHEEVPVTVSEDVVSITRVPIDRPIDAPPPVRTEGDTIVVPILEEVILIQRQLRLKEEVHLRQERRSKHLAVPVTRRRQRAVIKRQTHKKQTRA